MTPKEKRYHAFYMDVAFRAAQLSFAVRRKVGAVAVSGGNIIAFGFNGTPAGECNTCEDEYGVTLPSVVHAEENLLRKLEGVTLPTDTAMYITKEPCGSCSRLISWRPEINRVFYREISGSNPGEGLKLLERYGKICERI